MLWFCTRYPVEQGLKQFRGELENCSAIRTIFLLYFNLKTKTKNESPETLIDDNFRSCCSGISYCLNENNSSRLLFLCLIKP